MHTVYAETFQNKYLAKQLPLKGELFIKHCNLLVLCYVILFV